MKVMLMRILPVLVLGLSLCLGSRAGQEQSSPGAITPMARFPASHGYRFHGYRRGLCRWLRAEGRRSVAAWGYNSWGQISGVPAGTGFTAIAGGFYDGYALKADGSITAWGYNADGEISGAPRVPVSRRSQGADITATRCASP